MSINWLAVWAWLAFATLLIGAFLMLLFRSL